MRVRDPRISIWLMAASILVFLPGGMIRFVFPKLFVVAIAIALGALVVRGGRLPRAVVAIVSAGAVVFTIAALASETPLASLLGRWPRYEGLPVLAIYLGAAWLGAHLIGGDDREQRGLDLMRATAVVAIALGAASLLEAAGRSVVGTSDLARTGSVLGNATDQGLVAMMAAALLIGPALARPAPLWWAGLAAATATVVLSGSRAALLATALAFVIHLVARRWAGSLRVMVSLGVLATLAALVPQARDRLTNLDTVTGRAVLWDATGRLAGDHLLLGSGPSRFVDAIGPYEDSAWVDRVGVDLAPDSPHSWPLQALTAGGVPLLLIALALAVAVLVIGLRAVRQNGDVLTTGLFAASVGYGSALLVDFTIAGSTCWAAFLVGALISCRVDPRTSPTRWQPRHVVAVIATAAAVGSLMASVGEVELQHGIEAAARGDVAASDAAFTRATRWRPLDSDVAMIASQALAGAASAGNPAAAGPAIRWARTSLARTPDTYASGLAMAVARIAVGDLVSARSQLDDLIERFPVTQPAYVQRGLVRFGQRDVAGARADLQRARQLDPDDPVPNRVLAEIRRRTG